MLFLAFLFADRTQLLLSGIANPPKLFLAARPFCLAGVVFSLEEELKNFALAARFAVPPSVFESETEFGVDTVFLSSSVSVLFCSVSV